MRHLIARSNRICQIPLLSNSLIKLDGSHNLLTSLPPSITTVPRLSHIDLCLNQIPGPQLAAFVDTINSRGKNMSYIHFDRIEPTTANVDKTLPSTPLQGPASTAPPCEVAAEATGTQAGGGGHPTARPGGAMQVSAAAADVAPTPSTPRSDAASDATGDWHLVEGLRKWENVDPDELQRPEAN